MLCVIIGVGVFGSCCSMGRTRSHLSDANRRRVDEFVVGSQYGALKRQISELRTSQSVTEEQFSNVLKLATNMKETFYKTERELCLDDNDDEQFCNEIGRMFEESLYSLGDELKQKKGLSVFIEKRKDELQELGMIVENLQ